MCLGIPMQVLSTSGLTARCSDRGTETVVDLSLVGPVEPGTWLMVFLGAARETLSEEAAKQTADALEALGMAMRGETDFDHLFADLTGREPSLPDFLKPTESGSSKS
jgi:hydrogenase expression/formation protein HypC